MNARIEEFTPPGIAWRDRSNSVAFDGTPAPVHTVGVHPAAAQATGSQDGMPLASRRCHGAIRPSRRLGEPAGEVREHDVGAGPLDRGEVLERDGVVVDPAVARRRP